MAAKPALIIYSFAPKATPSNEALCRQAHDYLRTLWQVCDRLGMNQPVAGLGVTTEFPAIIDVSNPLFRILAAKVNLERAANNDDYQTFLFEYQDVVGFVATLEMNTPAGTISKWKALLDEWNANGGSEAVPDGVMEEVYLFTALYGNNGVSAAAKPNERPLPTVSDLGQQVTQALPGNPGPLWRAMTPYISDAGYCIWGGEPLNGRRTVALVAPQENQADLFKWTVWPDARSVAPFARYLMHAAKLRFAQHVFERDITSLHERSRGLNDALAMVFSVYQRSQTETLKPHELANAHDTLMQEQLRNFGLMAEISRLKELGLTSRIAARNMRKLVPPRHPNSLPSEDSIFDRDRARGVWLTEQIQMDLGYLSALKYRISEGHKMAGLLLERETQKSSGNLKNMVLLQGSVISAIAIGLAALQAFSAINATVVIWGVILLLMAIALAFPVLFERWHARYTLIDRIAGGFVGGTALFLVSNLLEKHWLHLRDASLAKYIVFSVGFSMVGFALGYFSVGGLEKAKGS